MEYIIVIPARGGSKGIPGKNTRLLGGKPLIGRSIEQAKALLPTDKIIVTTDDAKIAAVAAEYGTPPPFERPPELATDTASGYDVLKHAFSWYERHRRPVDAVVLLQPTSPFREVEHIQAAVAQFDAHSAVDLVVSVKEAASNPYYAMFRENEAGYLEKFSKKTFYTRQSCPPVYEFNGAIYVFRAGGLRRYDSIFAFPNIEKYVMSERASLDLDTPLDWQFAEFLLHQSATEQ